MFSKVTLEQVARWAYRIKGRLFERRLPVQGKRKSYAQTVSCERNVKERGREWVFGEAWRCAACRFQSCLPLKERHGLCDWSFRNSDDHEKEEAEATEHILYFNMVQAFLFTELLSTSKASPSKPPKTWLQTERRLSLYSPCALPVLLPNWTGQKNERNNNSFWENVWRANKRDYSLHIRFSEICTEWNSVFRFDLHSVTFCNSHRLSFTGSLFRSEKSLNESATKNMGLSSKSFFSWGILVESSYMNLTIGSGSKHIKSNITRITFQTRGFESNSVSVACIIQIFALRNTAQVNKELTN